MSEAKVLLGAPVARSLCEKAACGVEALVAEGIVPTLAFVRIGERPDDLSYERAAAKRAKDVGIATRSEILPADCSQDELVDCLLGLSADPGVHGVLLFRPLPTCIDAQAACNALAPQKDIDGMCALSLAGVFSGDSSAHAPCTAQACVELLDFYGIDVAGKNVVVVGRSLVIGRPVAMLLLERNATVTIAHSYTHGLAELVRSANIVVACVGRARMFGECYFCAGQTIIDVGINVCEGGKLVGDVDFDAAASIVDAQTPVPGGVGAITTAVLCKHVVEAAKAAADAAAARTSLK